MNFFFFFFFSPFSFHVPFISVPFLLQLQTTHKEANHCCCLYAAFSASDSSRHRLPSSFAMSVILAAV